MAALRVLVLDDNRDTADSLGTLLSLEGFEVSICYDPVEAVRRAATFQPNACILDLVMPSFDGMEVAKGLRAIHGPDLVLIAVTGVAKVRAVTDIRDSGFNFYLAKPAAIEELSAMITGTSTPAT